MTLPELPPVPEWLDHTSLQQYEDNLRTCCEAYLRALHEAGKALEWIKAMEIGVSSAPGVARNALAAIGPLPPLPKETK